MRGLLDDLPGMGPAIDMPPPGERLVADAHAAPGGLFGKLGQIGGGAMIIVDGIRLHI